MRLTTLQQVVDYQLCCGCGLCAYLDPEHIVMADVPTFGRRPRFLEGAENSKISQVAFDACPGVELSRTPEMLQRQGIIQSLAKEWGPILEIWEGYAADPEIRYKGSSGGATTAIALYCLEREGLHGVLHTVGDDSRPFLNKTIMSRNRKALIAATGSRYSPASPCEMLQEIENASSPCFFIGKPCDVAAVEKTRKLRPLLDAKVGLTLACFCAGTPSTNGTLEMLRQMGVDSLDDLLALRYRGCGWPGKTRAELQGSVDNIFKEITYKQSWGDILQKYRQWRCYICPDHTGEFADISTGDPWYRDVAEYEQGLSLIVARTPRGKGIIEEAIAVGYLVAEKVDPISIPLSQPNLLKTRAMLWGRLQTLQFFQAPCPRYLGFALKNIWDNELTLLEKSRSIAGTIKRIYKKKLKEKQIVT